MASYGQVRMRLVQLLPGIGNELIDGWMMDVYTEILSLIPWKRQESESVIQAPVGYSAGSVSAAQGNPAITGAGTNWTSAMNGRMIRINQTQEYYQFAQESATTANLDRPFEQNTAGISTSVIHSAGTGYAIGDLFNVVGGNGTAQGVIQNVDVTGAVLQYQLNTIGAGYSVSTNQATVTSGAGSGFTVDITAITPTGPFAYRIDQNVFLLPSNCRIVRQVRPLKSHLRPLKIVQPDELNRISPQRNEYGIPRWACPTFDNFSDPPIMQLELFPVPSVPDSSGDLLSWVVMFDFDADPLDPTQTSASLLPWMRPDALIAGVQAAAARGKDHVAFMDHRAAMTSFVGQMLQNNSYQRGPQPIQLADHLKRQRPSKYRRGPRHPGFTG